MYSYSNIDMFYIVLKITNCRSKLTRYGNVKGLISHCTLTNTYIISKLYFILIYTIIYI